MIITPPDADRIAYLSLIREIEDFLYEESDILDERQYEEWLELFAEDCRYWMPMRKNLPFRERARDITDIDDVAWFHDDKMTLTKRVEQIMTGVHWAEEPVSRVSHLVSNVRLMPSGNDDLLRVKSHFILHRNRLETETDWIAGRRHDTLRRKGATYEIVERKIIIDQSVLLAKNLTFFF